MIIVASYGFRNGELACVALEHIDSLRSCFNAQNIGILIESCSRDADDRCAFGEFCVAAIGDNDEAVSLVCNKLFARDFCNPI